MIGNTMVETKKEFNRELISELNEAMSKDEMVARILADSMLDDNRWWKNHGFNVIDDQDFSVLGYDAKFCLTISDISKAEALIKKGLKIEHNNLQQTYIVLDTVNNRKIITELLNSRFCKVFIKSWRNIQIDRLNFDNKYQLWSVSAVVSHAKN